MVEGPKKPPVEDDVLPQQIAEDEDGTMRVLTERELLREVADGEELLHENDLAIDNLDNDLPYTDAVEDGAEGQ